MASVDSAPLEGADFAIRAAARFVDVVVHTVAGMLAGLVGGLLLALLAREGVVQPFWLGKIRGFNALGFGGGLVGSLLFHTLSEGMAGGTPGKYACGLRVLLDNGRPCSLKAALVRSLGYFVDALFCGLIAYSAMKSSPLRQRHGDKWAGTVVVSARAVPQASRATAATIALAWTASVGLTIVIQVALLVLRAF